MIKRSKSGSCVLIEADESDYKDLHDALAKIPREMKDVILSELEDTVIKAYKAYYGFDIDSKSDLPDKISEVTQRIRTQVCGLSDSSQSEIAEILSEVFGDASS